MKHSLIALFSVVFLLCSFKSEAQIPDRKHGISVKRLFLDYHTPIQGSLANAMTYTGGWELSYSRNISQTFNLVVPVNFGVLNFKDEPNNQTFGSLDVLMQLQFYRGNNAIIPYAMAGVGGRSISNDGFSFQVPVGVGVNWRLGPWAYLSLQGQMRTSPKKERSNIQYGAGFTFMFDKFKMDKVNPVLDDPMVDTDSDGIPNDKDKCPEVAGVALFDGCPDTDGDGVADETDQCPEEIGVAENNGCPWPDQDMDGVPDQEDECPTAKGTAQFNGCPDTDGDGISDVEDDCPKTPGELENKGCPVEDTDGDGVPDDEDECPKLSGPIKGCPDIDGDGVADRFDECPNLSGSKALSGCPDSDNDGVGDGDDKCPNTAGSINNQGCPQLNDKEKQILTLAMQAVQFETGSANLKSQSFDILNQIYDIMLRYPNYNLSVSGHTDNVGNAENNLRLSERRAEACINYLAAKGGIRAERLSYIGYGEIRPIADNGSMDGRTLNRRVEFDLFVK